jgi:hypothetical protein
VRSPLRFKNVTLSLAGPAVSFERVPSDRAVLKPLFVELKDRRALLHHHVRPPHQVPHVTASIREIRELLVEARKQLKAGTDAAEWVDAMAAACRAYLDAVETFDSPDGPEVEDRYEFEPALREVRDFFRTAGEHVQAAYRLPEAREFVLMIYDYDRQQLDEQREALLYGDDV